MAKKQATLSRSPSPASTSSTLSCIRVEARSRESSASDEAASPTSTPPTSVPEESTEDGGSIKQPSIASASAGPVVPESDAQSTRRSLRPRSSMASHDPDRLSVLKSSQGKGARDFSGDTLVDEAGAASASTPQRQQHLLGEGIKALDLDWEMGSMPGDSAAAGPSHSSSRVSRRNSVTLDKVTAALGKAKSALGKRGRDAIDTGKEMLGLKDKRQSGRLQALVQDRPGSETKSSQVEDEESTGERPSKRAKLLSKLLPDLTGSSSRSELVQQKPKKEKRYETKGLYLGMADDFNPRLGGKSRPHSEKRVASNASSMRTVTASASKSTILPLPMFNRLEREKLFTLPFDVFAPTFRPKGYERPKDWSKVAKNRFVGDAKELWRTMKLETSFCVCKAPAPGEQGCGDDCINRALDYECDDHNCNLGEECTNRAFAELARRTKSANEYDIGVEVVKTSDRGFGVRANRCFRPGQIIVEYSGEVITPEECERRMREEYKDKDNYYVMTFDQRMIIDATKGSVARFVNHSCEPNCKMEKRAVAGGPRMALFAGDQGIMTGEELTYDYNFDPFSMKNVQVCRCGAENCRGVLGPRPKDAGNPRTKKEKEGIAAGLKRKATQLLASSSSSSSLPKSEERKVLKKRKTVPLPRGWAYVDPEVERRRLEEDEREKGAEVQATVTKVDDDEPVSTRRSRSITQSRRSSSGIKGVTVKSVEVKTKSDEKVPPQDARDKKSSLLARAASVLKASRTGGSSSSGGGGGGNDSKADGKDLQERKTFRQSTIGFPSLTTAVAKTNAIAAATDAEDDEDQTGLLTGEAGAKPSGGLRRAASTAKERLLGSVSKRT